MLNDQRALTLATTTFQEGGDGEEDDSPAVRDIHALTPPRGPRREVWETSSQRSSSLSVASTTATENFTSMSREFNALVLAGSTVEHEPGSSSLGRIREEDNFHEENNPLAIVPDTNHLINPVQPPRGGGDILALTTLSSSRSDGDLSVHQVKKEEVESKINAWQNAKIAKINNRFKREDAIINGWESEQEQKASSRMKKIEVYLHGDFAL